MPCLWVDTERLAGFLVIENYMGLQPCTSAEVYGWGTTGVEALQTETHRERKREREERRGRGRRKEGGWKGVGGERKGTVGGERKGRSCGWGEKGEGL